MRNLFIAFISLLTVTLVSCTDGNIGPSIIDTRATVIEDSSFVITGTTVLNNHVQARTSTQLLGIVNSKGYGTLTSDVVSQFMPAATIDTLGVSHDLIDSCRLTLRLPSDGFTGDSLVPMRLNVFPLTKQLSYPIYSDFNTEGFYDATQLLGSAVYSPAAASLKQSTSTEEYYREMYVPMPKQLALNIFDKFKESPETFKTPTEFAKFFPGLYITNSYGSGRIMNYYDAELEVFYKSHIVNDTIDTIVSNLRQSYIGVTPEIVTNNNIKLEPDQKIKDRIAAGEAIVMSPAGYELNVNFPIQDIIDKFYATTSDGLAVINTLELTIPVDVIDNEYDIAPPEYLLIVKKDKKDEFFAGDSLTNSKNSFYAKYDAGKKQYRFTGMRDYVLNIINNQKGIATAEDINLCITPIDVTTYTQQSSYYSYYYGSGGTQTVVTKIAPSISKPALARLRLDKAKVKITFSKQTVF